jgi:hypothetical protein
MLSCVINYIVDYVCARYSNLIYFDGDAIGASIDAYVEGAIWWSIIFYSWCS